ncbi:MAG: acyltransferase [Cytophagaceae bacterium]
MTKLNSIDFFKGVLVLLVILGHVLLGQMNESLGRTIIYSFHMPLFVGISGFLFNIESIQKLSIIGIFQKYKYRVIIPWFIAVATYYFFNTHSVDKLSLTGFVQTIIYPFFHLWFIPAYLGWIVITWLLHKLHISNMFILIIALLFTLITKTILQYPTLYQEASSSSLIMKILIDVFRPQFYFFFILGNIFRDKQWDSPNWKDYLFPTLLFIFTVALFYYPNNALSVLVFMGFNSLLLLLVIKICTNSIMPESKGIQWVGLNSLAIYLWHMIPILIVKKTVGVESEWFYYSLALISELIFFVLYIYLSKIIVLRKLVFGM